MSSDHPVKIRALIVDDEPLARSNVAVLLRAHPEVEIIGECGSGPEALGELRISRPDILFLDVQMPECDGFDVLEMLGHDLPPAVIFVTAYDQYALRAFEAAQALRQRALRTRTQPREGKNPHGPRPHAAARSRRHQERRASKLREDRRDRLDRGC